MTFVSKPRVIERPDEKRALVFCMRWSAIIGNQTERLAVQRARAEKATHYVCCGMRVASVGLAQIGAQPGWQYWSAAAAFAAQHPRANVAALMRLPEGGVWLVASRSAAVLSRSDRIFDTYEAGEQALAALCRDVPGLQVIRDGDLMPISPAIGSPDAGMSGTGMPATGSPGAGSLAAGSLAAGSPATGMDAAVEADLSQDSWSTRVTHDVDPLFTALQSCFASTPPLKALRGPARHRQHVAVLALTLVGVGGGVAAGVWALSENENAIDDTAASVDAAWQSAREHSMRSIGGTSDIQHILTRLLSMPIAISGWVLQHVNCRWVQPAWQCDAAYARQTVATDNAAFVRQFASLSQTNATVSFMPFAQAHVRWAHPLRSHDLARSDLPSSAWVTEVFATHIQRQEPAFSSIRLAPPVPLAIQEPFDAITGKPFPVPESLPMLRQRALRIEGPLRSTAMLLTLPHAVRWQSLRLEWRPSSAVSIQESPLHIALTGDVIETADSTD